jgi:hypothetical protein
VKQFQNYMRNLSGGIVNDLAEMISAGSLTRLYDFSGVIEKLKLRWNFGEYEAICETALARESEPLVGLIDEKSRGLKISCNCPFKK